MCPILNYQNIATLTPVVGAYDRDHNYSGGIK